MATTNMIKNYEEDPSYFYSTNSFSLKKIIIGPFATEKKLKINITDFLNEMLLYEETKIHDEKLGENHFFVIVKLSFNIKDFVGDIPIQTDLKCNVNGYGVKFYLWLNFWYATWNYIKTLILKDAESNAIGAYSDKSTKDNYKSKTPQISKFDGNQEVEMNRIEKEELIKKDEDYKEMEVRPFNNSFQEDNKFNEAEAIESNIYKIIEKVENQTDLTSIIMLINRHMTSKSKTPIDRNNLEINLTVKELDKFDNAKKMLENFQVKIIYSLDK